MSIGTGPDIPSYDRKREKEVKLGDEVQAWWDDLDDGEREWILSHHEVEWDEFTNAQKLDIYLEENGLVNETDEELEAQRVDAAERENHRQEVEGDIA